MSNFRLTEAQCYDVVNFCVFYLTDKFAAENGLFRTCVSQNDVRALQKQVLQHSTGHLREDTDPHVVAELLQNGLKSMKHCLVYDVYHDVLETEINEDNFEQTTDFIRKWLLKVPDYKYSLLDSLFSLLEKLATVDDNDTNLIQLGYCMAPTICRPANNAYMSIRHAEDLKKTRPVITFMIENYSDIFVRKISANTGFLDILTDDGAFDDNSVAAMSANISSAMQLESAVLASPSRNSGTSLQTPDSSPSTEAKNNFRLNLMVLIPSLKSSLDPADPLILDLENDPSVQQYNYSENEWKIFESLVCAKVELFVDPDEIDPMLARSWSASTEFEFSSSNRFSKSYSSSTAAAAAANGGYGIERTGSPMQGVTTVYDSNNNNQGVGTVLSSSGTGARGGGGGGEESGDGLSAMRPHRAQRRRMVADCKALRMQIFEFEQEWMRTHGRAPKGSERGGIQSTYTRYKELKKVIRDLAATDMQRCVRGFAVRSRLNRAVRYKYTRLPNGMLSSTLVQGYAAPHDHNGLPRIQKTGSSAQLQMSSPYHSTSNSPSANLNISIDSTPASETSIKHIIGGHISTIPIDMYTKYSDLLAFKRDLKRKLKKFDEDFVAQWGRAPRKSDKEIIRPMYQKYHEIKSSLDELRALIELSHGPLPSDLLEDGAVNMGVASSSSSSAVSPRTPTTTTASAAAAAVASSVDAIARQPDALVAGGLPERKLSTASSFHHNINTDDEGDGPVAATPASSSAAATAPTAAGSGAAAVRLATGSAAVSTSGENVSLEALQEEKRNLHAYLKVYERDFNKLHGRPVMRHEDIQPVAHEYQRYKELKALIRETKGSSSGSSSVTVADRD